jgi:endoglucanase
MAPRTAFALAGVAAVVTALAAPQALTADGQALGAHGQPHSSVTAARVPPAQIRLDQLGYLPHETKQARLMSARPLHRASFVAVDARGRVVLRGRVARRPHGHWNARYRSVYVLSFSRLRAPGRYRLELRGASSATSPSFRVAGAGRLYGELLRYGVRFDQVQRDGREVVSGSLPRKPSHLLDRHASVYAWPRMAPGSDVILDRHLRRIGGPVDVAGGWFDAGDYLKFTHTAAYNDVLLLTSARMLGRRAPTLLIREARHGLAWLAKMWDARSRTLYLQVGIGSGNRQGTFFGDHDLWRLPQADDHDTAHIDRFVSHRPVFEAAPPGRSISPNLVGRVSAAFALAAQLDSGNRPARARRELRQATLLYAQADTTSPPKPLVTALPHAFYPESSWRDDMELGAAEIALAARKLGMPARPYVRDAARWARGYIRAESGDTLNLYDTSALAHADLIRAMSRTSMTAGLAVSRRQLVRDLRRQLRAGVRSAHRDPFAAGVAYDDFDANSHAFGLVATAADYQRLTGRRTFNAFATRQRTWLLGGNPWGVSAMVGVGTTFPHCMQHQIANLEGSTDGSPPLDVGAVVNGPNSASIFSGGLGGFQDGMVHCHATGPSRYVRFDGRHSRYVDDVRSWQTDEPALDMTGAAVIAAAAELTLHPHSRVLRPPRR